MKRLLLLSNSTCFDRGYLDHAMAAILEHLEGVRSLLFVPFAIKDRAGYIERVRQRFAREAIEVRGLSEQDSDAAAIDKAEAIFVGGGNTFRLLETLQASGHLEGIRRRAFAGAPYLGASAGSGIAAPTIRTTNDMPIVEPRSFQALGLVPFQLNAHYLDPEVGARHMGETREQRIREFHEENAAPVVGLREGAWLRVLGVSVALGGDNGARVFRRNQDPVELRPGEAIDPLLGPPQG